MRFCQLADMASTGGAQAGPVMEGATGVVASFQSRMAWADVTREVKRAVPMPFALRHIVRWRVRGRRADCGLCKGHSTGTVAFTELCVEFRLKHLRQSRD